MATQGNDRREFLKMGGAALAATAVSWNATSYASILGANDRVKVGVIGVGKFASMFLTQALLGPVRAANPAARIVIVNPVANRPASAVQRTHQR